jgi:hypothetical protein
MTQEQEKLQRILNTRIKFMRRPWTSADSEVLKTKIRVSFKGDYYEKGKKTVREEETNEYNITPSFTIENVIEAQQRKLCRDIEGFVGKDGMDEVREVLVG